jgi:hypothetical protein
MEHNMSLLKELLEAKNHLGDREFQTYAGWKTACKKIAAGRPIKWSGDKDIDECFVDGQSIGEWDGEKGSIYS